MSAGSWIKGISVSTDQTFQECIADKLFMHGESFKMILTTYKISTQIPYRSECKMLQHNNVHGLRKTVVWENYMPYYISTVVKPCFILAQYFDI